MLSVGYDIVLVARMRSRFAAYGELEVSVLNLFKKLGITGSPATGGA